MQPGGCHNVGELSRLVDPPLSFPPTTTTKSVIGRLILLRSQSFARRLLSRIIPVIHHPKLLAASYNRPNQLRRTRAQGIWTPCGSGYLSLVSAAATEHNAQKLKIVRSVAIAHKRATAAANQ
jgi:hypothetical protein